MSDVNNVNEALEAIKTDVNAAVETKATIESVEANKAEALASVEAIKADMETQATEAKSASEAQNEKMEALEAKFAAMPITSTEIKQESKMEFIQDKLVTSKSALILDIFKAGYADNTDVTGGNVAAGNLIHTLVQANPFRSLGTVIQTQSGSIKLPQLSSAAFASEATNNASRTAGGSLSSTTVIVENWVAQNEISKPAAEDITGLDSIMASHMTQSAGTAEAADAVSALSAAGFTAVNTGIADALPAATAIVATLADMASNLSSAYLPGAKWYMSREALSVVRQSNDTVLNFDPTQGVFTIFGYGVEVIDQIAAGSTAGDNSVYFGNMSKGLAVVSRKELEISRFMETSPGMVTYFGDLRSKSAAWDTNALIALNSAL